MTAEFMLLREVARHHFRREEMEKAITSIQERLSEQEQLVWAWQRRAEVAESNQDTERS